LQQAIAHHPHDLQLVQNATHMPELMAWADVAISAGGSTCWEMAFMGLPSLILVLAENQAAVAKGLAERGVAVNLSGSPGGTIEPASLASQVQTLLTDPDRRRLMSEAGQQLVDGQGVKRVIAEMLITSLQVRPVEMQDAQLIWEWANDPTVRANAFHTEPIPLLHHLDWFKQKLNARVTRMWLLEADQTPLAQIRYDCLDAHTAEIAFSVAHKQRGLGLGTQALQLTAPLALAELGVKRLKGVVFKTNVASARAFEKAGFICVGEKKIDDQACYIFVKEATLDEGAER
jgi:RimJ/RimL family protein N-acetyltransferase